jgi:hypothetical protein
MKILNFLSALVGTATVAGVITTSSPAHALATWSISNLQFDDGTGNNTFDTINSGSTFQYDSGSAVNAVITSGVNIEVDASTNAVANGFLTPTFFNEYKILASTSSVLKLGFTNSQEGVYGTNGVADSLLLTFNTATNANDITNLSNATVASTPTTSTLISYIATSGTALSNLTLQSTPLGVASSSTGPIASTSGQFVASSGGGGGATVPFEVPGGATIPVLGSVLALGAMRKLKKTLNLI